MVAPGTANTMKELNEPSQVVGSLMVTIYVLGYAIGPLFLAPLSEIYGRYPVVILSTWFFNAWLLGSALAPTMPSLIAMRLLAGIGGSAVMTISPAVAADLYPVEKRAFTTSLIILSQCVGPAREWLLISNFALSPKRFSWPYLRRFHISRTRMALGK